MSKNVCIATINENTNNIYFKVYQKCVVRLKFIENLCYQ